MGNPKQKWTQEEEQALRDGVAKYGPGKWKSIHNDPAFANVLHSRSNIDLKDKWRNLSAAAQGLSTSRSRTPRLKLNQDAPVTPVPLLTLTASPDPVPVPQMTIQPSPVTPVLQKPATNNVKEEPAKDITDAKNASSDQIGLVFEALAAEPNGLDIASIVSYIEKKIGVESQPNFRKQLGAKLRRLHQQGKIDKGKTGYKLPKSPLVETISSNRKDIQPPSKLSLEDLAKTAACKVAEAEEKTHYAAKSVWEAEKYSKMLEESEARVQLCQEIYDKSHNSEVLVA